MMVSCNWIRIVWFMRSCCSSLQLPTIDILHLCWIIVFKQNQYGTVNVMTNADHIRRVRMHTVHQYTCCNLMSSRLDHTSQRYVSPYKSPCTDYGCHGLGVRRRQDHLRCLRPLLAPFADVSCSASIPQLKSYAQTTEVYNTVTHRYWQTVLVLGDSWGLGEWGVCPICGVVRGCE